MSGYYREQIKPGMTKKTSNLKRSRPSFKIVDEEGNPAPDFIKERAIENRIIYPIKDENKPIKRLKKAAGGRIEYSKGTMPARNKKNFRPTKSGAGMTQAGVKAYRRLNPGSKLKTAVTGKVKKGSKAAKRRKSYCARSLGQLKRASAKTRNDPNSRIRQARRRWKC
jgi:hypothetical protein